MPLDDNLLDAIAGTIAETEQEFRGRIDALRQDVMNNLDAVVGRLDKKSDEREAELGKAHLVIYDRLGKLRVDLDAADERIAEQLRAERLDLNENLFAATRRFDQLSADVAERLVTLKDGEAGLPGKDGAPGEKGDRGEPGEPAPDPTEDMVAAALDKLRKDRLEIDEKLFAAAKRFDRLSTEIEERMASLKDGEPGPIGEKGDPGRDGLDGRTGDARGLYAAAEIYRQMDRVSHNGSEWIAKKDDPGPLPGDGWMLGAQGKTGKPGASIQRAMTQDYTLVLEMTDGKKLSVDLRGMFERYDEERE